MKSKIEEILKKFKIVTLSDKKTCNINNNINQQMLNVRKDYNRKCNISKKQAQQIFLTN